MPYALSERRPLTPDAQGLARRQQWIQHLNPGMSSRYRERMLLQVKTITAHADIAEENRKRYIHHTYMQLNANQSYHYSLGFA